MAITAEALEAATASLSVEAQKRAAKDAQKKTAKAEAQEARQADKLAKSVVTIKRIERNKKKFVTAVIGLEAFGLDLKKVRFASPFPKYRDMFLLTRLFSSVGLARKGLWQEVCHWLISHKGTLWRRGNRCPGRRQRRAGRVYPGEVQGHS